MPTNNKDYQRKWAKKNPEYMKEWRKKNKEKILEYHKQWVKEHPGYMVEHIKASREKKPEYYKEQKREYARLKRLENKLKDEGDNMKFRNRGKHGFKRLKRQTQVYEYCRTNIKDNKTFTIDDIARDTNIPKSTLVELLHEIQDKMNGNFIYNRGYIEIKGMGNNGVGKRAEDVKGLKVYKIPKSTQTRNEKIKKIYDYLSDLASKDKQLPCLSELAKKLNVGHVSTVMEILKQMDRDNKIIYQHGKILAVNVPDVKADKEKRLVYAKTEFPEIGEIPQKELEQFEAHNVQFIGYENNDSKIVSNYVPLSVEPKEITGPIPVTLHTTIDSDVIAKSFGMSDIALDTQMKNYDKAVKELVADYIINADINTKDEILDYVNAIYKITDKLKQKLY